jgi:protein phosphatase
MTHTIKIETHGVTDIGQVRATNQDSISLSNENRLYIVADGMGGHAGGEIASELAIHSIPDFLIQHNKLLEFNSSREHPDPQVKAILADAVNYASTKIYERALEEPVYQGMGTTVTMIRFVDNVLYTAHVGDSRMYLFREGFLYQITQDHSLVSEQVRAGIITEEEAASHHLRNVITRSVGYQEEEYVDTYFCKLENNDRILICSDGLHGKLTDIEISRILGKQTVAEAPGLLIEEANFKGGEDNISVIVVSVQVSDPEAVK